MPDFIKYTEQESEHSDLQDKSTLQLLTAINEADQTVPLAVARTIPIIQAFVDALVPRMEQGGRLFYIGAGTSGRLGVVDASECPPTYGVPHGLVVGVIAGGDGAIRKAVEFAEDNPHRAWHDLEAHEIGGKDTVVGIAASGTTPYVVGGLADARANGLLTASISCNPNAPVAAHADFAIEVITGPEVVTGSTRMKAGTAQKLVLNMISTTAMIKLGRVVGNRMVDMQLTNNKLVDRGSRMVMDETGVDYDTAQVLLLKHGSVREAISHFAKQNK